ncbi:MAG: hypothetical protein RSE36_01855 [Oscillospiraceae bacterium]
MNSNVILLPKIKTHTKANGALRQLLLLCALFVIGISVGALFVRNEDSSLFTFMKSLVTANTERLTVGNFFTILIGSVTPQLFLLLFICLFGHCTFGLPLILVLVLCRGIGCGLVCGYIYARLGIAALLFNTLFLLPSELMSAIALILLSSKAARLSLSMLLAVYKQGFKNIKLYSEKLFAALPVCIVLSLGAAFAQAASCRIFSSFIQSFHQLF